MIDWVNDYDDTGAPLLLTSKIPPLGVFQKDNGAKVLSVAVHPGEEYVAASYSDGDIRIYRHPCQSRQVCGYIHYHLQFY